MAGALQMSPRIESRERSPRRDHQLQEGCLGSPRDGSPRDLEPELRNRLTRVMSPGAIADFAYNGGKSIDAASAMRDVLQHVRIDADGGIDNLHDGLDGQEVHSKLAMLQKDPVEFFVALLNLARTFFNPGMIAWDASIHIWMYMHDGDFKKSANALDQTITFELPVSLNTMTMLVYGFELLAVVVLSSMYAWRLASAFICNRDHYADNRSARPKYVKLATFFWTDMRILQNFSTLRMLTFVHPNLITKNYKNFSIADDLARVLLEVQLLGRKPNTTNDGEMAEFVIVELLKSNEWENEVQETSQVASWMVCRPSQLIDLLNGPYGNGNGKLRADWASKVRLFAWFMSAVMFLEVVGFIIVASLAFVLGIAAFFTKLCNMCRLLRTPGWSKRVTLMRCASFLNEILGIIPVAQLLNDRVETIIFGGSDALVSTEERFVIKMYLGLLAETVFKCRLPVWQKAAIMLQLDDDDLQQLVIEEDIWAKSLTILHVKHMLGEIKEVPLKTSLAQSLVPDITDA
eukprot:TRINITY_DN33208_c0_g1_i4.p1 TRINITY_DN33208_c0_g1~~TRINITY_DN33208_c0_g1_i4.p1  ORF type:complete len:546 (-),score=90.70 TRINITY_DN33208_c0_g1_i4:96-1649(-)